MAKAPYLVSDQPTQQGINAAAAAPAANGLDPELFRQLAANRAQAVRQQQGGIAQQEQMLKDHLARAGNQQMDLTPLLSFADQMSGWNTAKSYNRPTSAMGNMQMTADLQGALQKAKGALTDDEQQYQMSLLSTNQKADSANLAAQTGMYKADQMGDLGRDKLAAVQAKNGGLNQTAGQRTLDTDFAREYNDWTSGGESDVVSQLELLKSARDELLARPDDSSISGKMVLAKDKLGGEMLRDPESIKLQQAVQSVTAEGLKAALGSSFTEKDREFMTSMSYNLGQSPKENARRVARIIDKIEQKIAAKRAKAEEFRRGRGTLQDYVPAAPQAVAPQQAAAPANKPATVTQNGVVYTLNPATGEYE